MGHNIQLLKWLNVSHQTAYAGIWFNPLSAAVSDSYI